MLALTGPGEVPVVAVPEPAPRAEITDGASRVALSAHGARRPAD